MGFIMDGLDAEAYDRQYNDRDLVRRIMAYFRPERARLAVVVTAVVLNSLVSTGLPVVISGALDMIPM
jgi:hypothetical protein